MVSFLSLHAELQGRVHEKRRRMSTWKQKPQTTIRLKTSLALGMNAYDYKYEDDDDVEEEEEDKDASNRG